MLTKVIYIYAVYIHTHNVTNNIYNSIIMGLTFALGVILSISEWCQAVVVSKSIKKVKIIVKIRKLL